jgi:hypothetical protein
MRWPNLILRVSSALPRGLSNAHSLRRKHYEAGLLRLDSAKVANPGNLIYCTKIFICDTVEDRVIEFKYIFVTHVSLFMAPVRQ